MHMIYGRLKVKDKQYFNVTLVYFDADCDACVRFISFVILLY